MPRIHEVKILPEYFDAVEKGVKTWEYRFNDRNYAVGDVLILHEWKDSGYTPRRLTVKITYILSDFPQLPDGWVIMSIKKLQGGKILSAIYIIGILVFAFCVPLSAIFVICKLCAATSLSWIACCAPFLAALAYSPLWIIAKITLDAGER